MGYILDAIFTHLEFIILLGVLFLYSKHNAIQGFKRQFRILHWYIVIELLIHIVTAILHYKGINNLIISHLYFISQFILLSLFYKSLFSYRQKQFVNVLLFGIPPIIGVHFYYYPEKIWTFNVLEIFLTSIPLIIYSIIHLYNSLTRKKVFLYVNVGVLMYLSSSTLIFILGDLLTSMNRTMVLDIWMINKFLYIGYLILFIMEYIYAKKR